MQRFLIVPAVLVLLGSCFALAAEGETKGGLPLAFQEDFEKGASHWEPTDPNAWKLNKNGEGKAYGTITRKSKYRPPHRSPFHVALLKDVIVGDFVLTLKAKSTLDTGPHRDACIFFNYQDSAHFYYVHLGMRPDPHSSQIMIVNKAPRTMITTNKSPGIPWDDKWHDVKVVRRVKEGAIEVYFDDMKKPAMVAKDKTFGPGRIGIGSFDDHVDFDDIKLYGKKVAKKGAKAPK